MNRLQESSRRRAGVGLGVVLAVGLTPALLTIASAWAGPTPLVLHVSAQGNDAWNGRQVEASAGTKEGPFATLARARDELRKLKAAGELPGGATVLVGDGTYELIETLVFDAQDGGTAQAPVVYRAAEGAKPVLVGGRQVTAWKPAGGKVLQADLAALGFKKGARPPLLVCDGKRMPMARYPNFEPENPYGGGWAFADGKPVPMYQDVPDEPQNRLQFREADRRTWSRPQEVEVFVFPRYNWWNNIESIARIDGASRVITLTKDCSYPIRAGDRYYFRNAREELDAPGEWYVDTTTSTLYFQPPAAGLEQSVVVPFVSTLIRLEPGTSHLTLRGFILECAGGEALVLRDTTACTLAASTVRNVGDYRSAAVGINGGQGNRVIGNDIHDVGSHGVYLDGGDRVTLTSADNQAVNNYIHHVGLEYKQGVGVMMNGVGNRAAHNYIHDGPRMGIMFSGNNLVIEYNHIRHMNLETEDTGAVYTGGRDWISSRGTVIRYNYFHDMLGFGKDAQGKWVSPHFAWGVYLDDNTGGVDVIGNVVARCSRAGLHLHNGRDNVILNNVFIDNGQQQHEYSGWTTDHSYWGSHFGTMVAGYEKVVGQPAWKNMRNMNLHPRDAVGPDGLIMSGNQVERNIFAYDSIEAGLVSVRNFPFDRNIIDHNLVWSHGNSIRTGQHVEGPAISANLAPNPGFNQGETGALPADWQWQIKTGAAKAGLVPEGGARVLKIDAAFDESKPRDNFPIVVSREFALKPGHSYKISARMKADHPGSKAGLMVQSYVANAYFWANWPNEVEVGPEWKTVNFSFTVPAVGEKGYHPQMKTFRARVDFPGKQGTLCVNDVTLHEVEMLDEWASWQVKGADRNSVVADPLFTSSDGEDGQLRADSPAWKLGFERLPFEKMGPYQDELRASWPIVDAPGVREFPIHVPQP